MTDGKVEPYYQKQAKELTDLLHDKDFLNPELTRESMNWLENYIGFCLQWKCEMAAKTALLTSKLKKDC